MNAPRLAVLWLAAALSGCGGSDVYFELDVRDFTPGDGCSLPVPLASWALIVHQDGRDQCVRGPCLRANMQPFDCVEGALTPPVAADETLAITLAFYDGAGELLACDDRVWPDGVDEGDRLVLTVQCEGQVLTRCPPRPPLMDCPILPPPP